MCFPCKLRLHTRKATNFGAKQMESTVILHTSSYLSLVKPFGTA